MAPILAQPVAAIFNSSLQEGYVPPRWKSAIVTPLPKKSPPTSIQKDIRPISLTCILAKVLEKVIIRITKPITDAKLDPKQFGNRKGVSTTHLLINLLHHCHQAVDRGDSVRIVFLDYSKAFDRVNHNIMLQKLADMDVPPQILKWFASFLHCRSQSVRLGDIVSSPMIMNGAVPQGAMFGMEGFLSFINDLRANIPLYKYVDDSTAVDIIEKTSPNYTRMQNEIDSIVDWSHKNDMKINTDKTQRMLICFKKNGPSPPPILINGQSIESVKNAHFGTESYI